MTADPLALVMGLKLPTGQTYGEGAAGFQRQFFAACFETKSAKSKVLGREITVPRYRLVYSERRRGESKTQDLAAVALVDLLVGPARHRSYCVAADTDQASLILDSCADLIAANAALAELEVQRHVVINRASGAELRVLSSDDRTAYGVRPRRVYFDELSLQSDERLWTALWTAIGKSPASQMITASMAGWSTDSLAWRIRELTARDTAYWFQTRQGTQLAPWLSLKDWHEQRKTLHPSDFARFWECEWREPLGAWITSEVYNACETGTERTDSISPSVGFVDIGLIHDATAICVTRAEGDKIVMLTMRTLRGTKTEPVQLEVVENLVADLTQAYKVRHWIFEAPQAVASVQRLQSRLPMAKVDARYPTSVTQADLFGTLYRLFAERKLILFPHAQLRRETLNLVTKVAGGRMKIVDSATIHNDHVIALGGACTMLMGKRAEVQGWIDYGNRLAAEAEANAPYDLRKELPKGATARGI
jgi:hypothetical protein